METSMAKIVCEKNINGEDVLLVITTPANMNIGLFLKTTPGVGKPFYCWPAIPAGKVVGADFQNAPLVTSDVAANNALVAAITATPEEVLTYE